MKNIFVSSLFVIIVLLVAANVLLYFKYSNESVLPKVLTTSFNPIENQSVFNVEMVENDYESLKVVGVFPEEYYKNRSMSINIGCKEDDLIVQNSGEDNGVSVDRTLFFDTIKNKEDGATVLLSGYCDSIECKSLIKECKLMLY